MSGRLTRAFVLTPIVALAGCFFAVDRERIDRIGEAEVRREDLEFLLAEADSADPIVRHAACRALARIATPSSETVLARAAADPDPRVAREAIFGLGRIANGTESPALVEALRAADASSRLLAARALGQRGDPSSVDLLLWVAATDVEPRVREAAWSAMARLLGALREPLPEERCAAIAAQFEASNAHAATQGQKTALLRARLALPPRWAEPVARMVAATAPANPAERERRRAAITWLAVHARGDGGEIAAFRDDPDSVVRRIVRCEPGAPRSPNARGTDEATPVVIPGRDVPTEFEGSRPVLTFATSRGDFDLALAPAVAPVHCWLLWQAAHRGHLDGTAIVDETPDASLLLAAPALVTGPDGGTRRWPRLRSEPNPLPFARGTLGVANSDDLDIDSGRFLLTLQGVPELDGSATAIGRVVKGFDVVESLLVGDVIHRVFVSEASR